MPTLELFFRCYMDLRRGVDRNKVLKWRDVQEWCNAYELSAGQALAMQEAVIELDVAWIALHPQKTGGEGG